MAAEFNDGAIPYASVVLNINSVNYVAENVTITRPLKSIKRMNELGEPSGSVGVADFVEGSATLQCATTNTVVPSGGFSYNFIVGTAENFKIIESSKAFNQGDAVKFNVKFIKTYN